ncbi:shikimate kinase [Luteibacter pinisoli]|jgi:shikimate kinase|uniref:Shikimate kinase n=1 Tax=Luteibacter pinisoli TaxID=2589080 RepID=A0A4Y5Z2I1_9GAMM|nr:shikimate kinase [Luteibacter pinisoli]QDE38765.1 shikimate kinase [Luteibacter pinisoli]
MNPSPNLFLVGPTGAGKTTIGQRLAAHYGLPFVDLDVEIEKRHGMSIASMFEREGEATFRARESAHLDEFSLRQGIVLATGAGAVMAGANREILMTRGAVLMLAVEVDEQLDRLQHDTARPMIAGGDRRGRLEALADARNHVYEEVADLIFRGRHEGPDDALPRAVALLDRHWRRA